MALLLVDWESLRYNLNGRFRADCFATLLLNLLRIILGTDYVVFVLLVGLILLWDHWSVRYVILSGLRDHDQQLKWVSLRATFRKSQPSWETVDLVGLREQTFDKI